MEGNASGDEGTEVQKRLGKDKSIQPRVSMTGIRCFSRTCCHQRHLAMQSVDKLACSAELSDFKRGAVIGCHLRNKTSCEISCPAGYYKVDCGWYHKKVEAFRINSNSAAKRKRRPTTVEARADSWTAAQIRTFALHSCKHKNCSRPSSRVHQPHITEPCCMPSRQMEWRKARRHWSVEQWKRVLWSDESRFSVLAGRLGESRFGWCQENVTCLTALCQLWSLAEEG